MTKTLLLIFIGGGIGSCARYIIATKINQFSLYIPFGTLTANILSCLVAGFISYLLLYYLPLKSIDERLKLFFITGFCGGFSTFSSFALENIGFIKNENFANSLIYIMLSLLLCHLAILLGFVLAKHLM